MTIPDVFEPDLARWLPPKGVAQVTIVHETCPDFVGSATAYALAATLANMGFQVVVKAATEDVLMKRGEA